MERVTSTPPGLEPGGATDRPRPPLRALVLSIACLIAAAVASLALSEAGGEGSGFVWILALVPVFLFAYYRGWKGAAAAAAAAMVALTAAHLVEMEILTETVDWRFFGAATALLIPVTLGAGALSERLHRQKVLALEMAYRDPLTHLANRRLLREHTEKALARAERDGRKVGMIFLDLIRFKRVNDSLGHAAGDRVLTGTAERLLGLVRGADTVARIGGDEFAILLAGIGDLDDALGIAGRIREAFEDPFQIEDHSIHLEARQGVALAPDHAADFDELLSHADPARRRVRRIARDIAVFDPSAGERRGRDEIAMEEELRKAVHEGALFLHYQPVYTAGRGLLAGAEALVRWRHPEWGLVEAADFIPMAEHAGLIRKLEVHVLDTALRQAAVWEDEGPEWVSVNLSPATFEDPDFPDRLRRLLREGGVPPERLVLEITERAAMRDPERVERIFDALELLGVRLAIDDFGTGHSSLAYLASFPARFLKLDTSFVVDLGSDPKRERLVEGVIGLGRGLDMSIVAEGIERADQYEWIRAAGCDLVQGFFTGVPAPPDELKHRAPAARESAPS